MKTLTSSFPSVVLLFYLLLYTISSSAQSIQPVANDSKLVLDTFPFKDIPDSLQVVSCLCSDNKQDCDSNKFILCFPTEDPGYALISINHKLNFLKVVSYDSIATHLETPYELNQRYANATYTIILNTTISDRDDLGEYTEEGDVYRLIGKMTVKNNTEQSITVPLYGECGD